MNKIDQFLKITVDRGGSDLHLSAGYPPCVRVDGAMCFLDEFPPLTHEDNEQMIREILPERNWQEFTTNWDTDCSYAVDTLGRFRVNAFKDTQGSGAVLRTIPSKVPTLDQLDLGFSDTLRELCMHTKGLVIVTGPTGSGKSTTLAAMIDHINRTRTEHIITIEDPVEFTHQSNGCLINQREVHHQTRGFNVALRAALREDPDIVMLGEMRDLETTEAALEMAETGHLVFATLHTNTATSTVDRIIDKFPAGQQNQIRTLLANTLTAVVAQTLCKCIGGGRAAAAEVLITTSAARSMIRDAKTHQLPTAIQVGKNVGMMSFTESLFQLVEDGIVSPQEAYMKAIDKTSLQLKYTEAGIEFDTTLAELAKPEGAAEESPEERKKQAWKMANQKNTQTRNGAGARKLIEGVIAQEGEDSESLMILAAAQSETGAFKEAQETVKKAIQLAKKEKNSVRVNELKSHWVSYKKSQTLPAV